MIADLPVTPKRNELLDIASALFYEQGYGATGIKQIIDTAGIAKGTFYSHFSSKDELGLYWLRKRHAIWNEWREEATTKAKDAREKILVCFEILERWMVENDYRGCAFLNCMAEIPDCQNPMRQVVAEHKKASMEAFQSYAVEHFAGLPEEVGMHKGRVVYLLFEGALVETQNFRELWPVETARKEVEMILAG